DQPKTRLMMGRENIEEPEHLYITDWTARRAEAFIAANAGLPYLLVASFTAPHTPMEARGTDIDAVAAMMPDDTPRRRVIYNAMTRSLDRGVGRILEAIDRTGTTDTTLVIFINDNGGATNNGSDNGSLRGMKGSKWEGGVRVPFAMRWAGVIPPGTVFEHPVSSLDITATAAAAAGVEPDADQPLDGTDLIPFLTGARAGAPHETLFWRRGVAAAVRHGNFKLIRSQGNPTLLFDLSADRSEQRDVAAGHPDIVADLLARLEAWEADLAEPGWTEGERWERNQRRKHRLGVRTREQEREVP
ncbi:MAG: sulfatase-like hydrolase/transferase, partial [Planctomycetota bacterium]